MSEDPGNVFPFSGVTEVDDLGTEANAADSPPRKIHTCEVCGIDLAYNGRGRPPTRCPEHRRQGASATTGTRAGRSASSKTEREAKELAQRLNLQAAKLAMMVAPFDVYDGMTLMVMRKPVVEQYEGVMRTHDKWRAFMLETQATGSVFGLVVAVALAVSPILAHHGVIPETVGPFPIGQALTSMPNIMARLQKAAETGDEVIADYMARMEAQEAQRKNPGTDATPA